jgi:DNA-binding NarL/FixJ family response regulator
MNGLELKRHLDQDEVIRKKAVPFVFFSTSAMSSIVKEAFSMSVHGFFLKAQSLEELEKTLRVIFDYWEMCEHP